MAETDAMADTHFCAAGGSVSVSGWDSLLSSLLLSLTNSVMHATLTSKGQITIPVHVRNRLHLKPGDVLEFDETAPFLKATKTIPTEAWEQFGKAATDPWGGMSVLEIMDELRGPVELPAAEPA